MNVRMRSLLQQGIQETADLVNELIRAQGILNYLADEHEDVTCHVRSELDRVSELLETVIKKL